LQKKGTHPTGRKCPTVVVVVVVVVVLVIFIILIIDSPLILPFDCPKQSETNDESFHSKPSFPAVLESTKVNCATFCFGDHSSTVAANWKSPRIPDQQIYTLED